MIILLSPKVAMNLENIVKTTRGQEFSGVGLVHVIDGDICVYDIILMNVGSTGYTEISAEDLLKIDRPDKENIRLWFHRHPVEGWSGTDENTIRTTPLGGIPEITRWSASIVRTPKHWIGRVDDHINKKTVIVDVVPNIDEELTAKANALWEEYFNEKAPQVRYPFYPGNYEELGMQLDFIDEIDEEEWFDEEEPLEEEEPLFVGRTNRKMYEYGRLRGGLE